MNIAVVFAGGVGKRMSNSAIPKQFLSIGDKPIIIRTLEIFEECDQIDKIILVMVESHINYMKKLIKKFEIKKIEDVVPGGDTGQLSIYNGLRRADKIPSSDKKIVLIHDGVRPFISERLIRENIESVIKYGSAISCVKQNETVVQVDCTNNVLSAGDRESAYIAKAPQSFYLDDILGAHTLMIQNNKINNIDSCTLMLSCNKKLHVIECDYSNIKITTPTDYYFAKALIEAKENIDIFG